MNLISKYLFISEKLRFLTANSFYKFAKEFNFQTLQINIPMIKK